MSLVLKRNGGVNIALRQQKLPRFIPLATTEAAYVMIYWRVINADQTRGAWSQRLGPFAPGASVSVPYNPAKDQHVEVATISYSAAGIPNVSSLEDAPRATLLHQRESTAPTIGQNAAATADSVEIGIADFTRFARWRRVTISANADMSDPLATLLFNSDDYTARELPRYFILQRETGIDLATESGSMLTTEGGDHLQLEVLPATVYLTIAHSGGTAWTPESNILRVTFTAGDGSGSVDPPEFFDPTPRDRTILEGFI